MTPYAWSDPQKCCFFIVQNLFWRFFLKTFLQPIKSTLDQHMTTHYSGLINQLVDQAKAMFKETDPSNGKFFNVTVEIEHFKINIYHLIIFAYFDHEKKNRPLAWWTII